MNTYHFIFIYIININIVTFCLYGIDKRKAKHHQWRIPESTLLLIAMIGGSFGALVAMKLFHHKTKHSRFQILVPFFSIIYLILFIYFFV